MDLQDLACSPLHAKLVTVIASLKDWEMTSFRLIKQKKHSFSVRIIPVISIFISVFVFISNSQGSSALEPVTVFICTSQETGFEGDIFVPLQILQLKETKDELGFTDAQNNKINDLIDTTNSVVFKPYSNHSFHSVDFDEIRRQLDEARRMVVEILKPDQMARLKADIYQRYGLWSISKRDMRDLLHVTKLQTLKIEAIRTRMLGSIYAIPENRDKGSSDESCRMVFVNNEKTEKILAENERSILDLFTAEQREALNKLKYKATKISTR
jgi:hypothetical protein